MGRGFEAGSAVKIFANEPSAKKKAAAPGGTFERVIKNYGRRSQQEKQKLDKHRRRRLSLFHRNRK